MHTPHNFNSKRSTQHGDVAVYIALLMMLTIVSSTILMSLLLTRQMRSTENAIASERAFYAANSGLEQSLGQLQAYRQLARSDELIGVAGTVSYATQNSGHEEATYAGNAKYFLDGSSCVKVIGCYRGQQRRIQLGASDQCPEPLSCTELAQ